jgi:hypothetical protein
MPTSRSPIQKINQPLHVRIDPIIQIKLCPPNRKRPVPMKKLPMRLFQSLDIMLRKSIDPQPLGINQPYLVITINLAEGWHVMVNARRAAEVAEFADGHQMMHPAGAHHVDVITDDDVAGEHAVVGEQAIVSNLHIVGQMRVDHEKITVADTGHAAALFRAQMNGHRFPENVVLADFDARGRATEFAILRRTANHRMGMEFIIRADRRVADNRHVAEQLAPRPNPDMWANDAKRTDFHVSGQFGRRINDSMW